MKKNIMFMMPALPGGGAEKVGGKEEEIYGEAAGLHAVEVHNPLLFCSVWRTYS